MRDRLALVATLAIVAGACASPAGRDVSEQGGTTQVRTEAPAAASPESNESAIDRAMLGAVQILGLDPQGAIVGKCSGTVFHPAGYIVTNWHCLGVTHVLGREALPHGTRFHPRGLVGVAPTRDPREAPVPTYIAQLVTGSPDVDIAVVKIVGMVTRGTELPARLTLPTVPTGDSDKVKVGERIHVIGYPASGGMFLTRTSGIIAGFEDMNGDGRPDSFKTDAKGGQGISGGLWLNDRGEQIGVAQFVTRAGAGDAFNGAVFVAIARPFMDAAVAVAGQDAGAPADGSFTLPGTAPVTSTVQPTASTRPTSAPLRTASPTPARTATASPRPTGAPTTSPRATATSAPPVASPSRLPDALLRGTLIDADTRRPIADAVYVVFKEGVTIAQVEAASDKLELALTGAVSEADGTFVLEDPVAKGKSYTTLAGKAGYTRRYGILEIPKEAPDRVDLGAIVIKRE